MVIRTSYEKLVSRKEERRKRKTKKENWKTKNVEKGIKSETKK
jgi:hypothetical protein